jgi:hypothetical protein
MISPPRGFVNPVWFVPGSFPFLKRQIQQTLAIAIPDITISSVIMIVSPSIPQYVATTATVSFHNDTAAYHKSKLTFLIAN